MKILTKDFPDPPPPLPYKKSKELLAPSRPFFFYVILERSLSKEALKRENYYQKKFDPKEKHILPNFFC